MADYDDDFAARSRVRCAPTECQRSRRGCWVDHGGVAAIDGRNRCKACKGRIRIENWIGPLEEAQAQLAAARSRPGRLMR